MINEDIDINWGESVNIGVASDDPLATQADIFIGKLGQNYTFMTTITLTDGVGTFNLTESEMRIDPDTYKYQININHSDGSVEKYPQPEPGCEENELPNFTVHPTLDMPAV